MRGVDDLGVEVGFYKQLDAPVEGTRPEAVADDGFVELGAGVVACG